MTVARMPETWHSLNPEHPDDPGPSEPEHAGPTPEEREEHRVAHEVAEQRRRREAARRLAAEEAPRYRLLSFSEFLNAPVPESLVDGLLYRDSLSRMVGKDGAGKSFLGLDLSLRIALGQRWADRDVRQGNVVYVMAEGQRVNTQRVQAWIDHNATPPSQLEGKFVAVPDAILLTPEGVAGFATDLIDLQPALVVFDTKNAMMSGEENSATDNAVLRRAMDVVRQISDACVLLIDHTGYDGTRGRGSSALRAATDTEFLVESDDGSPPRVTVKVTRDKARQAGLTRSFHLRMHEQAAVLVPTAGSSLPERPDQEPARPAWDAPGAPPLPAVVTGYEGPGSKVVTPLARLMSHDAAATRADPGGIGVSRADAAKTLRAAGVIGRDDSSIRRAWSVLLNLGVIAPAAGVHSATGRHVWAG